MGWKNWEEKLFILLADLMRDTDRWNVGNFRSRFNDDPEERMGDYGLDDGAKELLYQCGEATTGHKRRDPLIHMTKRVGAGFSAREVLPYCSDTSGPNDGWDMINIVREMVVEYPSEVQSYRDNPKGYLDNKRATAAARAALAIPGDADRYKEIGKQAGQNLADWDFPDSPFDAWPPQGANRPCPLTECEPIASGAENLTLRWSDPGPCVQDVVIVSGGSGATAPNVGVVQVHVRGEGFRRSAKLILRDHQKAAVLVGKPLAVWGTFRKGTMSAELELTDAVPGCYRVIVVNGSNELRSVATFKVVEAW